MQLKSCPFQSATLENLLGQIQSVVDEMNLASYSHLDKWVENLEAKLEDILLARVDEAIKDWISSKKRPMVHEIVLQKHALYLDPPLQASRQALLNQLGNIVNTVCTLPRIQSSRYDNLNQAVTIHSNLLCKIGRLTEGYSQINETIASVNGYMKTWQHYQALWDMEANDVYAFVGVDLQKWQQLLQQVKAARLTFDTSDHRKTCGAIVIDFRQVQAQVSLRYDAWLKEFQAKFASVLADAMRSFHSMVSKMRTTLEQVSLEAGSSDVIGHVVNMQEIRTKVPKFIQDSHYFERGERMLQHGRFQFPNDWLWHANVQGEWSAFEQILKRKVSVLEGELSQLQAKILAQDKAIAEQTSKLCTEWEKQKPLKGSLDPSSALNTLVLFESRCGRVEEQVVKVREAKVALELPMEDAEDHLGPIQAELQKLKEVWNALSSICETIHSLRETPWTAVVPRKLRSHIEAILEELRGVPNRIRHYEAFDFIQYEVRRYKRSLSLVSELRSEALKERHWRDILALLELPALTDLTLGDVWGVEIGPRDAALKDIFRTAQGEKALEEFLRQVQETWTGYKFELMSYQNRCRLIRGWEDLFKQIDDHTNSLFSMKQSPFFAMFQQEATMWEEKLLKVRTYADIWLSIQLKWIYLEGIFFTSADIKQQLPSEYARFKSIDNEFVALMNQVSRNPVVIEVVSSIKGLDHTLRRLKDLLEKIQRALGAYLEKQRRQFPRFYFVGDEDLLEIIGNSKDPKKMQRHLNKMFAGINTLEIQETADAAPKAVGMTSREGEVVPFGADEFELNAKVKVYEWLQMTETAMVSSLERFVRDAVADNPLEGESVSLEEWVDKYPAQVVVLASQIAWSRCFSKENSNGASQMLERLQGFLASLAERILSSLSAGQRKKREQLVTEMVHQRDVLRKLQTSGSEGHNMESFEWLSQIRYSFKAADKVELCLNVASFNFHYGFEYQGVGERLVQTPLTERCYLALSQALHFRLGGNPFGPAGTGKTESVKALGAQMGRFTLVFNCDENFDLQAMGRLFVGLCQVGAWGCFDEFNRLSENILSAVSQQILVIQRGLLCGAQEITLLNDVVALNPQVGIFVTMNPTYAGRSNLPDNLKQLFRGVAMIKPDRELIAEVMLFSQGFKSAERLSKKITNLFKQCREKLSTQPHYDFGLRSVKSVLVSAGQMQRKENKKEEDSQAPEEKVLLQTVCETLIPKLVPSDVSVFESIISDVFDGAAVASFHNEALREAIGKCAEGDGLVACDEWVDKILQLNQVLNLHHGVMMVGPTGTGKSTSWRTLLKALELLDGVRGEACVLDPKAMSKAELYGKLDSTTMEWTDGIFTHKLRNILNNPHGNSARRHWIVFDGDVDPEWAENLNSVLDDNKILTLPSGERLNLPESVRILVETESLVHATMATVR